MWIKILRGVYAVAVATGFDQKIKDWITKKINGATDKLVTKFEKKTEEIETFRGKLEG